jgi:hypothetical protein
MGCMPLRLFAALSCSEQTMPQYCRQLSAIVVAVIAESATHASNRTCVGIGFTAIRGIVNHHRVFDAVVRGPPRANEFDRRDAPNGVDARPLEDTDLARAAPSRTDGAQHRHTPSCRTTIAKDIGFGHRVMDIGIRRHMQSMHDDFHTH